MECPYCPDGKDAAGKPQTRVLETRHGKGSVTRRRKCLGCKRPFTTVERLDAPSTAGGLMVLTGAGQRLPFDLDRLRRDIRHALANPAGTLPQEVIEAIVASAGKRASESASARGVIAAEVLGEIVVEELTRSREIYAVTRIRYALGLHRATRGSGGFHDLQDVKTWLKAHWPYGEPEPPADRPERRMVRKRHPKGTENWDQAKLERSIGIAAQGRGDADYIEKVAGTCAMKVREQLSNQSIITTEQIATEAMRFLRAFEPLVYLRYASAVKRFRTASEFWTEIEDLERASSR